MLRSRFISTSRSLLLCIANKPRIFLIKIYPMVSIFCMQEFDFDVDALFEHLFSTDSDVMKQIYESRKMLSKPIFFFCSISRKVLLCLRHGNTILHHRFYLRINFVFQHQ